MQRSIRDLIDARLDRDEIPRLLEEMRGMHDRAVGVLAATLVEDALEQLMLSQMRKLTDREYSELFMGTAPLSTFSARIRVSRAFKVISATQMRDMNVIRDIRNVFAHSRLAVTFQTREIEALVQKLGIIKTFVQATTLYREIKKDTSIDFDLTIFTQSDPRIRYIQSCALYDQMLRLGPNDPDLDDDDE